MTITMFPFRTSWTCLCRGSKRVVHLSCVYTLPDTCMFCLIFWRCPPRSIFIDYLCEYGSSWVHVGPWALWAHGPMGPMGLWDPWGGTAFAFGARPQQKHDLGKTDMSHMWKRCHVVDSCPNKLKHSCVSESFGG